MKTSPKGVAAIMLHEGVVTKAYRDTGGVWTIGVGHTSNAGPPEVKPGMRITREQAMDILASDLAKFEPRVAKRLPKLSQTAFDGAVSFDFNTGRIHNASWPAMYASGDMAKAETSLKSWIHDNGRVIKGLANRRKAEADLIFRGKYPAGIGSVTHSPPLSNPAAPDDLDTVKAYQAQLSRLGYYRAAVDGVRGPETIAAVKAFQAAEDLVVDGVVGPATRATLVNALRELDALAPPLQQPDDPGGETVEKPHTYDPDFDPFEPEPTTLAWAGWVAIGVAALLIAGVVVGINYIL